MYIVMYIVYTVYKVQGRGADLPFFLRLGHGPILDKSAAYSVAILRHMLSLYLPNSNSSNREAISTISKVFGITRLWVD